MLSFFTAAERSLANQGVRLVLAQAGRVRTPYFSGLLLRPSLVNLAPMSFHCTYRPSGSILSNVRSGPASRRHHCLLLLMSF